MINFNGSLLENNTIISTQNRGYAYGDALFETIKVVSGKILFWEDHYFRLMASMRILRMEIPMNFTMEYLEDQIFQTIGQNELTKNSARIKIIVFRVGDGLYLPKSNSVGFIISVKLINSDFYLINEEDYNVDLYKDHNVLSGLLSTLKTTNRIINIVGSIYAQENNLNNCLLINEKKEIVEALNGNIFLVSGKKIRTPSLESGCIKGIMRKQIIDIAKSLPDYELLEETISPFEIQKADELFVTNVISGIIPVSAYRKKIFRKTIAGNLLAQLNTKIRLY